MTAGTARHHVDTFWYAAGTIEAFDRPDLACLGEDPELFFPERGHKGQSAEAKAVCRRCPIVTQCRDWAVTVGPDLHGIFGATTWRGRMAMRARATGAAA